MAKLSVDLVSLRDDAVHSPIVRTSSAQLKDEAFSQQDRTLRCYLNPELLIIYGLGAVICFRNVLNHMSLQIALHT